MRESDQAVKIPEIVELWTFQPLSFYEALCRDGSSWTPDPAMETPDWKTDPYSWEKAYRWLIAQMKKRGVSSPTDNTAYPIWAWWWWDGEDNKKPNLKNSTAWRMRGKEGCVLLKLQVPRQFVCISDYHAWHAVLNYSYCALSEQEDTAFDTLIESKFGKKMRNHQLPDGEVKDTLQSSWERIFDVNIPPDDWFFCDYKHRVFQATLFGITADHVQSAWWLPPRGAGRMAALPVPALLPA